MVENQQQNGAKDGGILIGHFRENEEYLMTRSNGIDDWLIFYTIEGGGYVRTPAGEKTCGPGDVAVIRRGVPHTYGTTSGGIWHFMWAHFQRLPETTLLPDDEVSVCKMPNGTMQRRVLRIFRTLLHDFRDRGKLWQELCENQLSSVLLLVAEQLADRHDPRVSQVLRILSVRMQEPLTIDELAAAVRLSASRLSHLFKAETGQTILETLNGMRLEQAALLMTHAGRTASEAAVDVGFQSYNHFAALFRKRYGVGPANYRRKESAAN